MDARTRSRTGLRYPPAGERDKPPPHSAAAAAEKIAGTLAGYVARQPEIEKETRSESERTKGATEYLK